MFIVIFLFFLTDGIKKTRTIVTLTYFVKSAMATQNYQDSHFKTVPTFSIIKYPDGQTQSEAWLFTAEKSGSKSAIIMSPGTGLSIKNKILMIQAADKLRKAGVTVLIPFPQDLLNDITTTTSVESFKNAFQFMESQPNIDPNKIGYLGLCGGSMIALIASANPQISNKVSFVAVISVWANTLDYFAQNISKKTIEPNSHEWHPNDTTYNLTIKNILYRLDSENDRQVLLNYFLSNNKNKESLEKLTPQGKNMFEIISSKNNDTIREKLPFTSSVSKKDFDLLIPTNFINQIKATVFIMHDKYDNVIPVEESERLAKAFGNRAQFLETNMLDHTILRNEIPLSSWLTQGPKIFIFLYKVFSKTS